MVAIFMTTFPQHPLVEFSKQSEFLFHISVHFFIFSAFRKKHKAYYKKHKPYISKYKAFILKYVPCIFALFNFLINSNLYIYHKYTSIYLCFKALCPFEQRMVTEDQDGICYQRVSLDDVLPGEEQLRAY